MSGVHLIGLERRVVLVLGDERDIPVTVNEPEIAVDPDALDAGNLRTQGLEAARDLGRVLAALGVVVGGEAEQHDVSDHALSLRVRLSRSAGAEAIVPQLLIEQQHVAQPLFPTTRPHAEAVVDWALSP